MRFILLISLLMASSVIVKAQLCFPVKKVYAYLQPVTRGNAPREERKENRARGNHLVYLVSKSGDVSLKNVWINGERHAAQLKELPSPVTINNGKEQTVLVSGTKRKVYQLLFTALPDLNVQTIIPEKYKNSPLLLELQYRNKKKFFAVNDIKTIDILPLY
jgi:hypothetical protein